jgi:uncharacterized protein
MRPVWLTALACFALLLGASSARAAFVVPPIQGHVTDTAGVLSPDEHADLEQRLAQWMVEKGVEIGVFVVGSMEGETIEDVAYKTFNAWRIGRERLDNGVLLVIAPKEHGIRIETGKGIGGELTDLQASDIIQNRIAPQLRAGRYHDAIRDGTDGIAAALGSTQTPTGPAAQGVPSYGVFLMIAVFVLLALLRLFFFRGRSFLFWGGPGGGFGGGGGGGGGEGGGGYSGGGGRSGGGGASGGW